MYCIVSYCRDNAGYYVVFNNALPILSRRVDNLISTEGKKKVHDKIIKRSVELYGYTPEEKTAENLQWMLKNGYLTTKRNRVGIPGRPPKKGNGR